MSSNNLSAETSRTTWQNLARGLGLLALGLLVLSTAGHAILITLGYANLTWATNPVGVVFSVAGVSLVEVFAALTAVRFLTHSVRAKQKPVGIIIEALWILFAAMNLTSSFAIMHGEGVPAFVSTWVSLGLPITGLVVGVLYYVMERFDPQAQRQSDDLEVQELLLTHRHDAKIEVLNSPQMQLVIRQATWLGLPEELGRQMGLSEHQIQSLRAMAPDLLTGPQSRQTKAPPVSHDPQVIADSEIPAESTPRPIAARAHRRDRGDKVTKEVVVPVEVVADAAASQEAEKRRRRGTTK